MHSSRQKNSIYLQEEGIDIEGMDSDAADEDEEALLQAMDAEDAAKLDMEEAEMKVKGENVDAAGKICSKESTF